MTIDQAFNEVNDEIKNSRDPVTVRHFFGDIQCPVALQCLISRYAPIDEEGFVDVAVIQAMTQVTAFGFEAGWRYGRTQVLEELGMPKVEA